ncbi:hypothetical protein GDO81_012107 [Engystomops pustulosus]|uniref:Uncharacterized protein n=1 Tax=Engystomops pustulosus TaxID=76066 RepID=A0AAV7BJE6_ENGPU|nr:hypothetical protein GDO81_012107 [Engystomops pustulosus]
MTTMTALSSLPQPLSPGTWQMLSPPYLPQSWLVCDLTASLHTKDVTDHKAIHKHVTTGHKRKHQR